MKRIYSYRNLDTIGTRLPLADGPQTIVSSPVRILKMRMEGLNFYIGKRIFIILKNKRQYSGIVMEVADIGNGVVFISIRDKFNRWVTFSSGEIEVIQEEDMMHD